MQQHVLITILVFEGRLEVVGKDIPRKVAQMIELKRKVADPQTQIQSTAKPRTGKLRDRLGPSDELGKLPLKGLKKCSTRTPSCMVSKRSTSPNGEFGIRFCQT